jgi:hypothetical protein
MDSDHKDDFGLDDVPKSPDMAARIAGVRAHDARVKIEDGPEQFNSEWREGWQQARVWKSMFFMVYRRSRSAFDKKSCPSWASRATFEGFQKRRKETMDKYAKRYPDFPAAYVRHMTHMKGKG